MSVFSDFDEWYRDLGDIASSSETRLRTLLRGAWRAGARRGAVAARGGRYPEGFDTGIEDMLRGGR